MRFPWTNHNRFSKAQRAYDHQSDDWEQSCECKGHDWERVGGTLENPIIRCTRCELEKEE